MPKRGSFCRALLFVSVAMSAAAQITVLKDVMVPMRDGVKLATDIYLPAQSGARFPAILLRTPYNKDGRAGSMPSVLAGHGYALVIQDVRGRYKSEGHWFPIRGDPADGFDTAKWIGGQSWSDGSIGTIGTSYEGATQHALAIAGAPYVKAMIPRNAMSNFGRRSPSQWRVRAALFQLGLHAGSLDGNPMGTGGGGTRGIEPGGDPRPDRSRQRGAPVRPRPAAPTRYDAT